MNSKAELVAMFKKLLKLEESARDLYNNDLKTVTDPDLIKDLEFIRDQEVNHVSLAKQALQMLGERV